MLLGLISDLNDAAVKDGTMGDEMPSRDELGEDLTAAELRVYTTIYSLTFAGPVTIEKLTEVLTKRRGGDFNKVSFYVYIERIRNKLGDEAIINGFNTGYQARSALIRLSQNGSASINQIAADTPSERAERTEKYIAFLKAGKVG